METNLEGKLEEEEHSQPQKIQIEDTWEGKQVKGTCDGQMLVTMRERML